MLYLGSSLKVCFLETVLRDERDGIVGQIAIAENELDDRRYAGIRVRQELHLLDLTGDGPVRMGIPSDVARGRRQGLARKWSVAFHEHPDQPDGIVYPSRLNGETNLAIYSRAVGKLELLRTQDLKRATGLPGHAPQCRHWGREILESLADKDVVQTAGIEHLESINL